MSSAISRCLPFAALLLSWAATAALAADKALSPFNGKDLQGWRAVGGDPAETLKIGAAKVDPANPRELVVAPGGADLVNFKAHARDFYTEAEFGDAVIEVEFMVPQGSNSGIYVMGEYEIQILDSYGRQEVGPGDVGGLYGAQAPRVNAAKAPGEWQKFVIEFRAPRFSADGAKTANARFVRMTLNGQEIHADVEMKGPTPGGLSGREQPRGPLMFQGNHGPVAFRNIRVMPIE